MKNEEGRGKNEEGRMKNEEGRGKNMHYMTVVSLEMSDESFFLMEALEKVMRFMLILYHLYIIL